MSSTTSGLDSPRQLRRAELASRRRHPAGREVVWRSRSKQTPALLVKMITDKKTTEPEKQRYLRAFDFINGPEKDAALLQLLTGTN